MPSSKPSPVISVVMPVFNSGDYLLQAVDSVLAQKQIDGVPLPEYELIIVDDASTDERTIALLQTAAQMDRRVRVVANQRSKGAAGARNTGIMQATGDWIGFIDSDDIWLPHALALRWHFMRAVPEMRWVAARFKLLTTSLSSEQYVHDSARFDDNRAAGSALPPVRRMARPFLDFSKSCLIQTTTVLIRRDLIVAMDLFNETLHRAEDYHLWFKCAVANDLWLIDDEISYYRIHGASLTHGDAPRFLKEDLMIGMLLATGLQTAHRRSLVRRLDFVLQDECYFYRHRRQFDHSLRVAAKWVARRPFQMGGWKELLASALRRG